MSVTARTRSGSQRLTPFAAPGGHDGAACACAHPEPESVHACAAPIVRLERPLALGHGCLSLLRLATITPPLARETTMAVGKLMRLARNRRGSHGPSFPRTEDQSGFAAVPPTFGRLFEGTEVFALGQTCGFTPRITRPRKPEIPTQPVNPTPHRPASPGSPRNLYSMLQNGWHSEIKLLASANAFSDREGPQIRSEGARSTTCADIAALVNQ